MKWFFTEVRAYSVDADTQEEAIELYEDYGPEVSVEEPVEDLGLVRRGIQKQSASRIHNDRISSTGPTRELKNEHR